MKTLKYFGKIIVCTTALFALCFEFMRGASAQAGPNVFLVWPDSSEGNTSSTIPFTAGIDSVRFQQVYDFHGLTLLPGYDGPFLIQLIAFREDAGRREGFYSRFSDFQINLSTTGRAVDGLSPIFDKNVGSDDRAVVPRGSFQIGVGSGGGFSAQVGLALAPFYYDPSQGNLLLDIRNFWGGETSWGYPPFSGPAHVDAWNLAGDRVSSVSANSVNANSGTISSLGLVTEFWFTPIPEPSTVTLLLVGLVAFGFSARLRRDRNR